MEIADPGNQSHPDQTTVVDMLAAENSKFGDPVSIGEPVVEIDSYSMTHEIQAPVSGILSRILVSDGGFVEPGNVLGTIDQV